MARLRDLNRRNELLVTNSVMQAYALPTLEQSEFIRIIDTCMVDEENEFYAKV